MKEFNEWYKSECKPTIDGDIGFIGWTDEKLEDAFKAGMLVAAEISELAKEFILPADDLADLIAKQIREFADED